MEKDLEILGKYESWFRSAIYSDYIRALWRNDFDLLVPVYEKWTGKKIEANLSCPKCKLNFIKKLGKIYYKKKEEYEREQEQKTREIQNDTSGAKDFKRQGGRDCKVAGNGKEPKANKGRTK